jgi:NAD(P)-dependent dehydrogenase (short-subunit alcohol dehydrogenase family)
VAAAETDPTGFFAGKTIAIAGAARGIGAATAHRLAGEGATVVLIDVLADEAEAVAAELRGQGGSGWVLPTDLADPDAIALMGEAVARQHQALHGLVNAAGTPVSPKPVAEMDASDWDLEFNLNLRASALCVKALTPLLREGPGHIVNISSQAGFTARPGRAGYDSTKAGVAGLTRTLACELAEYGIRVNTVAPGGTVTERHFLRPGDTVDRDTRRNEMLNMEVPGILVGRFARPEEIAACIRFLLSDEASYVNATMLEVNGGAGPG